jgi:molybdate transport system regulatory protein
LNRIASLSLRIDLQPDGRIGRGKIELLEQIGASGSISAGARAMRMSYKRAWDLVEEMKGIFGTPVVATQSGGKHGGGASLTPTGLAVVSHFRAVEKAALAVSQEHRAALQALVAVPDKASEL